MEVYPLMQLVYFICGVLLLLSLLAALYRLIRGPGLLNRVLAFDLLALCIISLTVVFNLINRTFYIVEIVLVFCLLGFVTTIAVMDMMFRGLNKKEDIHE